MAPAACLKQDERTVPASSIAVGPVGLVGNRKNAGVAAAGLKAVGSRAAGSF
ncbi:MAG: hypothetical protein J6A79_02725 [Clostridia bacterium]|nr:hypothetical protein [Clostridia bacterium]